jgi:hypothetical protein
MLIVPVTQIRKNAENLIPSERPEIKFCIPRYVFSTICKTVQVLSRILELRDYLDYFSGFISPVRSTRNYK